MMNKKLLLVVAALNIGALSYSMDPDRTQLMHTRIMLPSQEKIKEIIGKVTGNRFVEVTKIDEDLGDSTLSPIQISEIVYECIKYFQCPPNPWIAAVDGGQTYHLILKAIFRDSPNVYQKLFQYEAQKLQQSKL